MPEKPKNPSPAPESKTIQIQLPADTPVQYTNGMSIFHDGQTFLVDFILALPGQPTKVTHRMIMTPAIAKIFVETLQKNIQVYETSFGVIVPPTENDALMKNDQVFNRFPIPQ